MLASLLSIKRRYKKRRWPGESGPLSFSRPSSRIKSKG
jgi:hypothetical protein